MSIAPVTSNNNQRTYNPLKSAKKGAAVSCVALTTSTGISWLTNKGFMSTIVEKHGGISGYLKTYALGLAICSLVGAGITTCVDAITNKLHSKKSPKAVN